MERKEWQIDLIKHTVCTYEILNTIPLLKKKKADMWGKLSLSHKGRLKVQDCFGQLQEYLSQKKKKRKQKGWS